ncbi:MAG: adventurous gliding motility protein [Deltaproteobacteria bacterium]|nr:adventurous gliding motility protein [Deltaproteobacteria bacterium]
MSAPLDPAALVRDRHIIVCVGTGGVGKTTLAASFALAGARLGRRTAVLTIDPARRLADALGIAELGNQPTDLPRERLTALGVPPEGRLAALMLDMKRTFDELVARFADSEEARQHILGNRIYQHISDALAGSAEYSAMEKVFELSERRDFDLIVVDTPPSQHALDFLEAPRRLVEFLDSRLVQLLLHPALAAGRFGVRLFQRGSERVLHLIERVSGVSFLEDISEFLLAFEGMSEGFRERAREVQARLVGPDAAFVLAASPAKQATRHALEMLARLSAAEVPLAGVVVNRVHTWPGGGPTPDRVPTADREDEARRALAAAFAHTEGSGFPADEAARAALAVADGYAALVRADAESTAELTGRVAKAGGFVRRVPELSGDVHDLEGLARVAEWVFRTGPENGEDA